MGIGLYIGDHDMIQANVNNGMNYWFNLKSVLENLQLRELYFKYITKKKYNRDLEINIGIGWREAFNGGQY